MSRSGYSEDLDNWDLIRWRGAVESAMKGRRGQDLLRQLLHAMDELEDKRLAGSTLQAEDGTFCMLGLAAQAKDVEVSDLVPDNFDPDYYDDFPAETLAKRLDIAPAMAKEVMFMNDEIFVGTQESRFDMARNWLVKNIRDDAV